MLPGSGSGRQGAPCELPKAWAFDGLRLDISWRTRPSVADEGDDRGGSNMHAKTTFGLILWILLAGSSLACGGAQAPGPGAPPAGSAEAPATAAPGMAWKDMNHAQRLDYMKKVVFPTMKPEFMTYDAKRYGAMTCLTCHGDGAKNGSFKMPNPELPKLPADEAGFKKLSAEKPEAVKFMGGRVVPNMAKMLGEEPFNMQTKQGFGCFECHTK
jgi:hypothetical protein